MAVVPDTTTFTLQDVVDAVIPTTDDLVDCFADANLVLFDTDYYSTGDDLLEFRNYGETTKSYVYLFPEGPFTFDRDGTPIQSTRVWYTLERYQIPEGWDIYSKSLWINVTVRQSASADYMDVTCDVNTGYDREGSIVVYDENSDTYATLVVYQEGDLGPV